MAPRDEFLAHFEAFMASGVFKPLEAFLQPRSKARSFPDLLKCLQAYFDVYKPYGPTNERSLRVFHRVVELALGLGDLYFALRVEVLTRAKDRVWHERFAALEPAQQRTLDRLIARKKGSLSRIQRRFLKLFDEHMTGKSRQKEIAKDASDLMLHKNYGPLQDCLRAYIEVSQGYKDGDQSKSVLIFYGLSHSAIFASPPDFAATYSANAKEAGSVWKKRYDALDDRQRSFLDDTLQKKLTLYKETVYKGKTYREPVGKYEAGAVQTEKPAPGEEQPVEPVTAVQRDFDKVLKEIRQHGLAKREASLHDFLRRTNFSGLRECVTFYLRASDRRNAVNNEDSRTVFFSLLSTAITKGDAYYAYKVEALVATGGSVWAARFAQLSAWQKGEVRKGIDDKRKASRFLDELRFAYYLKHRKDADLAALRGFEPASNPERTDALSKALSDVEIAASVRDVTAFGKAFDAFSESMRAQKDRHLLLVLMKRCRERRRIRSELRQLLYLYGVGLLYQRLLDWRPLQYARGFNDEERDFLITHEEKADRYYNDFVLYFEHVIRKKLGAPGVAAACKAQGALHLYAWKRDMRLTPMKEAAAVRKLHEVGMAKQRDVINEIAIPINSRFGEQKLRIGQTIASNCFIVWWDPKGSVAYVQLKDFGDVVFELDSWNTLGARWDANAFYGEVYRSTQHLLDYIQIVFEVLTYLPELMTGGVSGLVIDLLLDYALEKTVDALGIDPMVAQVALLGLGLVGRGGGRQHGTSSVEPDFSEIQQKSMARLADRPVHGEKSIDVPLKSERLEGSAGGGGHGGGDRGGGGPGGGGHGGGDAPPPRGTDMRGVETKDGILIRGDDSPAIEAPTVKGHARDGGLQGDRIDSGSRSRGEHDAPQPSAKDEMLAAERHVEDLQQRIQRMERGLDQTEHSAAGVKHQLEIATDPGNIAKIKNRERHLEWVKDKKAYQKRLEEIAAREAEALAKLRKELPRAQERARTLGSKVLGEFDLPAKPTRFRKGAVEVESWRPDAYVGTTDDRRKLERLLNEDPLGDLSKALLDGGKLRRPKGKADHWAENPDMIELAHVHSRREGGRDVYIVMSKSRNQQFNANLERTGGVFKEDALVIQGIAIDRMTALELVAKKKLSASVVANARVIKFVK